MPRPGAFPGDAGVPVAAGVGHNGRMRSAAGSVAVGRDREIAAVADVLRRARSGAGSALVIRGDAGIGKTTLLDEGRGVAVEEGMCVLWCRGCALSRTFLLPRFTSC